MSDALNKLIEAVEAGVVARHDLDAFIPVLGLCTATNDAHRAYYGSLDAAKALHEALLPGFRYRVEDFRAEVWWGPRGPFIGSSNEVPARAWLLAILRAYAAQQESTP